VTLTLYGYWRSSSTWRVRIGLALKGLGYRTVPVDLLQGEQWQPALGERSPLRQVPVLEVERPGHPPLRLVQSMAILEWLEERAPEPALLPRDVDGRARVRALAEHVNAGIQPLQNSVVLKTLREKVPGWDAEWARTFIARGLEGLEAAVRAGRTGRFAHEDAPGLADCYLVPQLYNARRFGLDPAPYPTLLAVEAACQPLSAFQAAHPDRQPDAPPPERRSP
jgi:maleylpyruvate isomerase